MTAEDLHERIGALRDEPPQDEKDRPKARAVWRKMSDVDPRKVEALWPGYLVKRKHNILAGYGGVGKDQMMAAIIARGSNGDPLPSMLTRSAPIRTLIVAAEDDAHEDWRPRLDANGADLDNVLILDGVAEGDGPVRWPDVKMHMPLVNDLVREQDIDVVYFSPLSSYMPGAHRNDSGDVRDALGYIQRFIDDTGVTVVSTLHIGKATDRPGALRILGSVEFVNAARNVLAVNDLPDEHQPDDVLDDPTRGRWKVLEVIKSNSMIPGPPLAFSRPLDAAVEWHGQAPIGFDESFRVPSEPRDARRQDAEDWLSDFLKGGMQPASKVKDAAKAAGISPRTLRRAREALKVRTERLEFQGPFYWSLPTGQPNRDHVGDKDEVDNIGEQRDASNRDHVDNVGTVAESPNLDHLENGRGHGREDTSEPPTLTTSPIWTTGQGCTSEKEVLAAEPGDLHHCQRCGADLPDTRDALCPACGSDEDDMREALWAATADFTA